MTGKRSLQNALLVSFSVLLTIVMAEAMVRWLDGLPIFADYLPSTVERDVTAAHVDDIQRAPGVARDIFFSEPPPLPNRRPPPDEWVRWVRDLGEPPIWATVAFRPAELFKAWNSEVAKAPCEHPLLKQAPGHIFTYRSQDGQDLPRFRFLPNATTPLNLVTNELGWRGPPVDVQRKPRTIRIVFVGASTTINSHYFAYSYPELVGHWLNVWAAQRRLDVRFEALNAGRESASAADIEAIVRLEVMPLQPELVVYYESAAEFDMSTLLKTLPTAKPQPPTPPPQETGLSRFLRDASYKSALARRLQAALGMLNSPGKGDEWPKPPYEVVWPAGLNEKDPDLTRSDLPMYLSDILRDVEKTRKTVTAGGGEFAVSTSLRFAREGLVLDPVRNRLIIEHLNVAHHPFRYSDIERMSQFRNRVFAKYAAQHDLMLFDIAGKMPQAPDLFSDAVHLAYGGVRLHAWIVLQQLVPVIEKKLASGAWPRPATPIAVPPGLLFKPDEVRLDCRARQ
jgi:hypothetical protein